MSSAGRVTPLPAPRRMLTMDEARQWVQEEVSKTVSKSAEEEEAAAPESNEGGSREVPTPDTGHGSAPAADSTASLAGVDLVDDIVAVLQDNGIVTRLRFPLAEQIAAVVAEHRQEERLEAAQEFAKHQAAKPYSGDASAAYERALGHITGSTVSWPSEAEVEAAAAALHEWNVEWPQVPRFVMHDTSRGGEPDEDGYETIVRKVCESVAPVVAGLRAERDEVWRLHGVATRQWNAAERERVAALAQRDEALAALDRAKNGARWLSGRLESAVKREEAAANAAAGYQLADPSCLDVPGTIENLRSERDEALALIGDKDKYPGWDNCSREEAIRQVEERYRYWQQDQETIDSLRSKLGDERVEHSAALGAALNERDEARAEVARLREQCEMKDDDYGRLMDKRIRAVGLPGQKEISDWCVARWGEEDLSPEKRALCLAEEVGEICRAITKRRLGHKGTPEEWTANLHEEIGDVVDTLRQAVIGRKIVAAGPKPVKTQWYGTQEAFVLELDNGTQVQLVDTDDCCAYTSLKSFFLDPKSVDHAILGVGTTGGYTTWHVYADFGDVMKLDVGWSCGNPFYYGYGFDITVEPVTVDGASDTPELTA